jgi:hypothetical protein
MARDIVQDVMCQATEKAAAIGMARPVILALDQDSSQARAIADELESQSVSKIVLLRDGNSTLVAVATKDACSLLAKHASKGGEYVAQMVGRDARPCFWQVLLSQDSIRAVVFLHGAQVNAYETAYDSATVCKPFEVQVSRRPSEIEAAARDGQRIKVRGKTGRDALTAAGFVECLVDGETFALVKGRLVPVKFTDDELAATLGRLSHRPGVIAAAILALKDAKGGLDQRVMRILRNRPKLRALARQVENQLKTF